MLRKIEAGEDLTPHLSDEVNTAGIILPGAKPSDRRADLDMVLTREGLHHFHVPDADSPGGRSGLLVFAEVLEREFRVVAISNHEAFQRGSAEHERFFGICRAYMAKDIPPGQSFMPNPVMSSGHSMLVTLFARHCDDLIRRLDPQLDDPAFVVQLYAQNDGQPPSAPRMRWQFADTRFGLLEQKERTFFCLSPFFSR